MSHHSLPLRAVVATCAVAALALTACAESEPGSDASPTTGTSPAAAGAFPVTVAADNGEFTFDEAPQRIVSLSATATEMLFAIGAGDQVVAVDNQSNFPPEAPLVDDLSGYDPNIEAIASLSPDLVLFATEPGELASGLHQVGITAVQFDAVAEFDGIYSQIERLGVITGHIADAAQVVAAMQTDLREVLDAAPEGTDGLTYFHELDPTFYTVTSGTFIGAAYAELGLVNIADEAGTAAGSTYPQMSEEAIIEADPDLVFLADATCCDMTVEDVAARPGWEDMTATATGGIIVVDEDLASRWGPRLVDFLAEIVAALEARATVNA